MNTREISCFAFGLGLGVAASMLFAPREGRQTRCRIQDKVKEGQRKLQDRKEAAYNAISRQKDGVSAALGAAKSAYREATGGLH